MLIWLKILEVTYTVDTLEKLWLQYNEYSNKLAEMLGRTNNIVGEYAEHLALKYYGGELLAISGASADIKALNGALYQVKARKLKKASSAQLGIIRSWDFDFLVVIIFYPDGKVQRALEFPVDTAKEYGKPNAHQNGWVITTNQDFLTDERARDITEYLCQAPNL